MFCKWWWKGDPISLFSVFFFIIINRLKLFWFMQICLWIMFFFHLKLKLMEKKSKYLYHIEFHIWIKNFKNNEKLSANSWLQEMCVKNTLRFLYNVWNDQKINHVQFHMSISDFIVEFRLHVVTSHLKNTFITRMFTCSAQQRKPFKCSFMV